MTIYDMASTHSYERRYLDRLKSATDSTGHLLSI